MTPNCPSGRTACVKTLGGGFEHPTGVMVDGAGNIYVADQPHNAIKVMPPNCPSASTFPSGSDWQDLRSLLRRDP